MATHKNLHNSMQETNHMWQLSSINKTDRLHIHMKNHLNH